MKRTGGFTLIELMITLMVVAILAMLAAPSFTLMVEKSRLKGAADDVVTLLQTARLEAVKRHRSVNVAFGGPSTSAWCVGANRAPDVTAGHAMLAPSACDCTVTDPAATGYCLLENTSSVVTPPANGGVTTSTSVTTNVTFNGQLGNVTLVNGSSFPATAIPSPLVTLISRTQRFALQISLSPLGQVNACVPAGYAFISGYTSC